MEQALQKFLPSGCECTLISDNGQWTVDMWQKDGTHHWCKTFNEYYQALAEYKRWSD